MKQQKVINRNPPNKPRFKDLIAASTESDKQIQNANKERRNRRFNRFNMIATICFGMLGAYLAWQANIMNKRMLSLTEKADSTSLDLAHFNQLLDTTAIIVYQQSKLAGLSAAQIDSMVALINQTAKVADVVEGQFDMNAYESNSRTLDMLNKRIEDYNNLYTTIGDLQKETIFYRLGAEGNEIGNKVLKPEDVNKRVAYLDKAYKELIKFTHINDLLPKTSCMSLWEDCVESIGDYKTECEINLLLGFTIDTTTQGIRRYHNVLGKIANLIDSFAVNIPPSKAVTQRQAKIVRDQLDNHLSPTQRIIP